MNIIRKSNPRNQSSPTDPRHLKPQQLKFHVVKVPIKQGGKLFLYFRRYTANTSNIKQENNSKSVYDKLQDIKTKKQET